MINENKVVGVTYTLNAGTKGEPKTLVETADASHPLVWLYGVGSMIPTFEVNLLNKKVGDTFDFLIAPELAYGSYDLEGMATLPIDIFHDENGKIDREWLKVGISIPMTDNEGNQLVGKVLELQDEFVKMDFNHPLAGKELHFIGEVIEVRDATQEELAHGHVHGPHGHQH